MLNAFIPHKYSRQLILICATMYFGRTVITCLRLCTNFKKLCHELEFHPWSTECLQLLVYFHGLLYALYYVRRAICLWS